jgi:putative addiction module component (TIGR02574 family)
MSLESRKLELMQQLLLVDSEEVLERMQDMLNAESTFVLSDAQKAELDTRKLRYERGESRTYTLEETKSRVRASLRK